jgi:hypothetical protein
LGCTETSSAVIEAKTARPMQHAIYEYARSGFTGEYEENYWKRFSLKPMAAVDPA